MRILSVGALSGLSNTCLHRHWALNKIGDKVDSVNTAKYPVSLWFRLAHHLFLNGLPARLPDNSGANEEIKAYIDRNRYEIVWIDKGNTINANTLLDIKKHHPQAIIVSFTADNMAQRHNQSRNFIECIPLYDFHITTKSYIINDLKGLGAKEVIFTYQGYEPTFHYPRKLNTSDYSRLGGDVGFVGMWEQERCDSILSLAKNGINVRVFGGGRWKKYRGLYPNLIIEDDGLFSDDYPKSLQAFKISLCFLRKINSDLHTSRTMEIPACGGFMLAERTKEHETLFTEAKEAAFFSSNLDLLEKCRYYLSHEEERINIAQAGIKRCEKSGYSNVATLKRIIRQIIK